MTIAAARRIASFLVQLDPTARRIITHPSSVAWPSNNSSRLCLYSAAMATSNEDVPKETAGASKEKLPTLSDHDFRSYNYLADRMELFHNGFRQEWNLLWQACTTNRRPQGYTLKQLLSAGLDFANHLNTHHSVEEAYVFPRLAQRMPEFDPKKGSLVKQHEEIHEGLVEFESYLRSCRSGERDFEMSALKEKMEGWGGVLWAHLDDEVRMLGAENMRKHWNLQEIKKMGFF